MKRLRLIDRYEETEIDSWLTIVELPLISTL